MMQLRNVMFIILGLSSLLLEDVFGWNPSTTTTNHNNDRQGTIRHNNNRRNNKNRRNLQELLISSEVSNDEKVRLIVQLSDPGIASIELPEYGEYKKLDFQLEDLHIASLVAFKRDISIVQNLPFVENVELDHYIHEFEEEDKEFGDKVDDLVDDSWYHENQQQRFLQGEEDDEQGEEIPYGISMIQADQLSLPDSETPIKICIVDSGYDLGHEDLPQNTTHGLFGFVSNALGATQPWGPYIHGTGVAGIVAAIGGNGIGTYSVLRDPSKFHLLIGKGFEGALTTEFTIMESVSWCVLEGAKIINLSLNSGALSYSFKNVFESLYVNKDVLFVASAGNTNDALPRYPGSFPHVMSCTGVDVNGTHLEGSSFHDQVEIAAPAQDILTTAPGNRYQKWTGTSGAAAYVSGVAALVWSHFPECTNSQIRTVLLKTAKKQFDGPNCDPYYGEGVVQAKDAYDLLYSAKVLNPSNFCDVAGGSSDTVIFGGCEQLAATNAPSKETAAPTTRNTIEAMSSASPPLTTIPFAESSRGWFFASLTVPMIFMSFFW